MNLRNYIEIGVLVLGFAGMLFWKILTKKKLKKMDGIKGENDGVSNGDIVGKFGDSEKH